MSTPPPPPTVGAPFVSAPTSPRGEPLAEPWLRIVARLLDLVCLIVIDVVIVLLIAGDTGSVAQPFQDVDAVRFAVAAVVALAFNYVWEAVLTKVWGGTPFKLLFGLRVVGATDGAPITWGQSSGRWALTAGIVIVPLIIGLVFVVSLILLFRSARRQALWDQLAKTLVVKRAG